MTPEQRVLRAKIAALTSHVDSDGRERTRAARETFRESFGAKIRADHPDLPEPEVQRRAAIAKRLHYARLAYQSVRARNRRKAGGD